MPHVRCCPYCRKCFIKSTYQMFEHATKCKDVNPYPPSTPNPIPQSTETNTNTDTNTSNNYTA